MTEDEQKLEQCQQDILALQKNETDLLIKVRAAKEPKWIAAVSDMAYGGRLILNLAMLPKATKEMLRGALEQGCSWFSFAHEGYYGDFSSKATGLTNYPNTEIVF